MTAGRSLSGLARPVPATASVAVEGVRTVAAGDARLAPTITRRLVEQFVARPRPGQADAAELEALPRGAS